MNNVLIFGDSIAWGAWDKEGGWAQRLKDLTYEKAEENDFNKYTSVYSLGISGNNTDDLVKRFENELKTRKFEGEKLNIIIGIGINDSCYILAEKKHWVSEEKFEENLLKLIEISKKYNAQLFFVGLTPVDKRVDPNPWEISTCYRIEFVEKYNQIIKEIAKEQNVQFIELLNKFPGNQLRSLLTDGLHPSTEGHIIIFEEVKKALKEKNII